MACGLGSAARSAALRLHSFGGWARSAAAGSSATSTLVLVRRDAVGLASADREWRTAALRARARMGGSALEWVAWRAAGGLLAWLAWLVAFGTDAR